MQPLAHGINRFALNRRAAFVLPLAQGVAGLVGAGLIAAWVGRDAALAFLAGAGIVALGQAVFGWRTALRAPVVSANRVFLRLWVGALLKWLVIGAGLVAVMTGTGLPGEFVFAGVLGALLTFLLCISWLFR